MARAAVVAAATVAAVLALGSAFILPSAARSPAAAHQMQYAQQPAPTASPSSLLSLGAVMGLAFGLLTFVTPAAAVVDENQATIAANGNVYSPPAKIEVKLGQWNGSLRREPLESDGKAASEAASSLLDKLSKIEPEMKVVDPARGKVKASTIEKWE